MYYLLKINSIIDIYIELFVGGVGILLKLLIDNWINIVWINDYDKVIYLVWDIILNDFVVLIFLIELVFFDYYFGYKISLEFSISFWKK